MMNYYLLFYIATSQKYLIFLTLVTRSSKKLTTSGSKDIEFRKKVFNFYAGKTFVEFFKNVIGQY